MQTVSAEGIKMINYKRMLKDCFWDYDFTGEEIAEMASSSDERKRLFLFQKILLNSTSLFNDLKIFRLDVLEELIRTYKIPTFNYEYTFKRKNMAEVYFLNRPILVNGLKWVV